MGVENAGCLGGGGRESGGEHNWQGASRRTTVRPLSRCDSGREATFSGRGGRGGIGNRSVH